MGPITTPKAAWIGKHVIEIGGYREIRPSKVTVESVAPVVNGIWNVALKVQIEKAPAGAVEAWALFLRKAGGLRIELRQDADLFEDGRDQAPTGTTVTLSSGSRSVTIGVRQ
jgi:hypothetical protein